MVSVQRMPNEHWEFARGVTIDHLGFIYGWFETGSNMNAVELIDLHYKHGGGFKPFVGFELMDDNTLVYPGDPVEKPIAKRMWNSELVVVYESSWVAIIQKDRSFVVCRCD